MKIHKINIHEGYKVTHKCKICATTFSSLKILEKHLITHSYKDHKCDWCGKTFSIIYNLKTHIKTVHNNQKDYKCESCSKSFSSSSYLKKHNTTIHEGHKYFKCNTCGKSFSQGQNLKRHKINIHKNASNDNTMKMPESHENKLEATNPFNSEIYVKSENVQDIIRTIFDCNLCDMSYIQKHELIHHINIFHKGLKEFFCQLCADKFDFQRVTLDNLNSHIKNIHEGQTKM